uniref:Ribosomal protein S14 n=1 Tax=Romanomermis culicivorax TaxID=13658 RepID=A0A915HLQ2_ROMCU
MRKIVPVFSLTSRLYWRPSYLSTLYVTLAPMRRQEDVSGPKFWKYWVRVGLRFLWFDTRPTLSDRIRVKQNIRRLQSRLSELPLRSLRKASGRHRRGSVRSGYAFSHQQGFGDLITRGIVMQRLAPIKEMPA